MSLFPNKLKAGLLVTTFALITSMSVSTQVSAAGEVLSSQELLRQVKQGRSQDAAENKKREKAFLAEKASQEAKIAKAQADIQALEAKSSELEKQFSENELLVEEKRKQRDDRLGQLKELFGHLTGAAGDAEADLLVDAEVRIGSLELHQLRADLGRLGD